MAIQQTGQLIVVNKFFMEKAKRGASLRAYTAPADCPRKRFGSLGILLLIQGGLRNRPISKQVF
jgi:hypothetical protein